MRSKWKVAAFGELLKQPLRNGLTKPKAIRGKGCKLVNMGELFANDRISTNISMDLVPVNEKELCNCSLERGDLLFARQSLVLEGAGKCSLVHKVDEEAVFESHLIRARLDERVVSSEFYYYYFSSSIGKKNIESIVEQVAAAGIRGSDLVKLIVPLPPLDTQCIIAATLSCLDDKIELNNKINTNLETQAQTIFKNWFVDFEPFQNAEFVDSEMGLIPKGWRVGTLSDIGTIVGGATPSKAIKEYYTNTSKGIAWITPKDLSNNRDKFIFRGELDITELGFKHSSTRIMPQGTVLFSSRAPIGYMAIAENDVCTNQGFKSVVPDEGYGTAFVYYTLKYKLKEIQNLGSGSTFKEVSGNVMKKVIVLIPDTEVLNSFNGICEIIFNKQRNLEKQNHTLADLRDTLLPKLMNGEIKVPISDEEVMESYD